MRALKWLRGYPQRAQWSIATMSSAQRFLTRRERNPFPKPPPRSWHNGAGSSQYAFRICVCARNEEPAPTLFFPRVVGRINAGDTVRAHAVQLNDGLLARPREMLNALRHQYKSARLHHVRFALIEFVAKPNVEHSG